MASIVVYTTVQTEEGKGRRGGAKALTVIMTRHDQRMIGDANFTRQGIMYPSHRRCSPSKTFWHPSKTGLTRGC